MDMAARAQVAQKEEMRVQGAALQVRQGDRASLMPLKKEGGGSA